MSQRTKHKRKFLSQFLFLHLLAAILSRSPAAQQIPATEAKTLDGTTVSFPHEASGRPLLFVIGFSHKSSDQCEGWNKRLAPVYLKSAQVFYYQLADLTGAPSFAMKMILHGMRKQVSPEEQSRYVLLEGNDDKWKTLVSYSAPDDAYVVLTSPNGHVLWQARGPVTDPQIAALESVLAKLNPPPK